MALALLAACEGSLPAAPTAERPTAEYAHSTRSYDPLVVQDSERATSVEAVVHDAKRDRDIPLRVYLPHAKSAAPVVLFSHGLGGSRDNNVFLGEHWARRGYVAVFLQHPGSDESVWKSVPRVEAMAAMRSAASLANALLRFADVPAVIDALTRWNESGTSGLRGRLDLHHVGMSGHSFGAITAQAVSGERVPEKGALFTDVRIKAAFMMSPSLPRNGASAADAFGAVGIPWLLMTGTKDVAAIGDADVASRLAVFPALPVGGKYELVLDGAAHMAFSDFELPGVDMHRNPHHHRVITALSTAFWDAWLKGDTAARAWLDGVGPRTMLAEGDRWQRK